MDLKKELTDIVENEREKELLSFLKKLDPADKKELTPCIQSLCRKYFEFHRVEIAKNSFSLTQVATYCQREMLVIAGFVCFSKTNYDKIWGSWMITRKDILNKVIDWYCPNWFSEFINDSAKDENIPGSIQYDWIMELAERGYITPSRELITRILPMLIYVESNDREWDFDDQRLLQRKITLDEHIWYLFELDSNIHSCDRYLHTKSFSKEKQNWIQTLETYSSEKKISRIRLLKESILATTRNFNKAQSGWFCDVFAQLNPSQDELLELQDDLFTALGASNSKVLNLVLHYFKKLVDDKKFKTDVFLDSLPLLFSSETKSVLSSSLTIAEKIAKKHTDKRAVIVQHVCQTFLCKDDDIQLKAAKFIQDYGLPGSVELKDTLSRYHHCMKNTAKTVLQDFMLTAESTPKSKENFPATENNIPEKVQIQEVVNFDELLFLVSQSFENNQTFHIDLLPSSLLNLQHEITKDNVMKLEPGIQRAYKLLTKGMTTNHGFLDHLLASFMLAYTSILMQRFPSETADLKKKYPVYDFEGWRTDDDLEYREIIYDPYKLILSHTLSKLRNNDKMPLLSTPTHTPGWIAPTALIERLYVYQSQNQQPHAMDLQFAISRCSLDNHTEAIRLTKEKLTGEYKHLMLFLLGEGSIPGNLQEQTAWVVASVTKFPKVQYEALKMLASYKENFHYLNGQFQWKTYKKQYTYERYNYQTKKEEITEDSQKVIEITFDERISPQEFQANSNPQEKLIYDYMKIKSRFIHHNDIQRLILLTPNNPEPLLAQVVDKCFKYSTFSEEDTRRCVVKTADMLYQIWNGFGEMAHLFVATCMISSDKTVRSFGAEIWIKGVRHSNIQSECIGKILGKHQQIEFAPLNRFTDLAIDAMINISEKHNEQLEILLVSFIKNLSLQPVSNLKKLLETYLEILSINASFVSDKDVIRSFRQWKEVSSLTKTIKRLEEKMK